ncbi:unnamed protein product [Schistocephalus solidus]|uniref:Protein arginine N-methyltransferase n=1 Tax=Schistocephalus solidus TaxID=70667 RepID=A0A183SQ35_SCHSO|nr:unnamed protein product [Schistocephalus solidus]
MHSSLVGLRISQTEDLKTAYTDVVSMGYCRYAFVGSDLFQHSDTPKLTDEKIEAILPAIRSDQIHSDAGDSIAGNFVGYVSSWIDCDAPDAALRTASEKCLLKELNWAAHLALRVVCISLRRLTNPNLARILTSFTITEYAPVRIWISVPMSLLEDFPDGGEEGEDPRESSPWHWWTQLVILAGDTSESFGLLLELGADLPSESVIRRWLSEPVSCLSLSTDIFLLNSKGYPVLSGPHQSLNSQIIVHGECKHERGLTVFQQYINWLWKTANENKTPYEKHSRGLEDQLQEPLQPLQDNLSSTTYGVFEMDSYKYTAYEEAIYMALLDRRKNPGSVFFTSEDFPPLTDAPMRTNGAYTTDKQVIFILGAGRGPFVAASLQASERSGCPVRIYVVEKNPNALLTLRHRLETEWKDRDVHLVPGDMRWLSTDLEKADIFVSELLGSFGDNELSPECLDGAQHLLKDNGISIPSSYTSYIAPLQSLRIHQEAACHRDICSANTRVQKPLETPYVVRLQNFQLLDDPKAAFTFTHPRKDSPISGLTGDNSRFTTLTFTASQDAMLHGFAGYFDAVLFGKIDLSTHPHHHSPNMFSWFPLVFPLETSVPVRTGEQIVLHLWRCVSTRHVWYEWALTAPVTTKVHNAAGSAYKIGL